jgi:hypothetical protein
VVHQRKIKIKLKKMAKKEKVVDLKPKVEKVNEEELGRLRQAVNTVNAYQVEVGRVEAQKHSLLHQLSQASEIILELQKEMEEKYGSNDINLQDGSIKYEADEG